MDRLWAIFSAGNGSLALENCCAESNWLFGCKLPTKNKHMFSKIFFADNNYKNLNWSRYLAAVEKFKPFMCTVPDLMHPRTLDEVLQMAGSLSKFVSRLIIIPKISGTIPHIPLEINNIPIILGYSVPSSYGATELSLSEFSDRPVHLLGGTPIKQLPLFNTLNVVSLDTNVFTMMACMSGKFYDNYKWYKFSDVYGYVTDVYTIIKTSLANYWNELSRFRKLLTQADYVQSVV